MFQVTEQVSIILSGGLFQSCGADTEKIFVSEGDDVGSITIQSALQILITS